MDTQQIVPVTGNPIIDPQSAVGLGSSGSKRSASTSGSSPKAKRATRREVINNPPVWTGDVPHIQLVQEVNRLFVQMKSDAVWFESVFDQINNHADCLEALREFSMQTNAQLRWDVQNIVKQAVENDTNVKTVVQENDQALRSSLDAHNLHLQNKLRDMDAKMNAQEEETKKLRLDALVIQQGRLQTENKASVNKDDLLSMVRYGAETVFSSEANK